MILSNKLIKIIFLGLFVIIVVGFSISTAKADNETPQYRTPSGPGFSLGPWVTVSAFKLQPKSEYFVKVNQSVTIKTTLNMNGLSNYFDLFGGFKGKHFKWYKLEPNSNWKEITHGLLSRSYDSPNYTFQPKKTGIYYFQAFAQVSPRYIPGMGLFNPPLYSKVAKVVVQKEDIATQRIDNVTTDDPYMIVNKEFQNQTMFAHADVFPSNATDTDKIVWTTDTPDLIQIDSHSGEIFVNKKWNTGMAKITASIGDIKSKAVEFPVQKMLTLKNDITKDDTVNFKTHETASFLLHGDFENSTDTITWHQIGSDGNDTIIDNQNQTTLNIEDINSKYNNVQIYAVMQIKNPNSKKEQQHSVTSNKMTLTVDSTTPTFKTDHQITNTSFHDDSSNYNYDEAYNTIVGDKLTHIITISNTLESNKKIVTNGSLIFEFCPNESINSNDVTIQGKPVDPKNIKIDNNVISINNIDTNVQQQITISISSKINNINSKKFTYEPKFTTHLINNTDFPVHIKPNYATFTTDSINIAASKINFGKIIVAQKTLRNRVSPEDNDSVLTVDDNRRHKSPVSLWLHFSDGFKNKKLEPIKDLSLHYFDDDQQEQGIYDKVVNVETSSPGEPLQSISWPIDEGLKLSIDNTNIPDGTYTASIRWEIRDVPQNN